MSYVKVCGSRSWKQEQVTSAAYYRRPLSMLVETQGLSSHHGIVIDTDAGHSYLLHAPGNGKQTMCFPISSGEKLTDGWEKDHDIPVNGYKTVENVYDAASERLLYVIVNYLTAVTCTGAPGGAYKAYQR